MKPALFAAVLLLLPISLQASTVKVVSPNTAQTYSYSDVTWHSLHWDAIRHQFSARITFSNYNYVTHNEWLAEESYDFEFPGVSFDHNTNTFFAKAPNGHRVAVAELSRDLIGQSIKPLPGTVIHLFKRSGKVLVVLTGSDVPPGNSDRLHWAENNSGFFLDNAARVGIDSLGH